MISSARKVPPLRERTHGDSRTRQARGLDTSPILLFASSDEWMSRSVGTVFEDRGFSVVRAASGALALTFARRIRPDVVLLDDSPGGLDAVSVCRALRDDPLFDPSIPVIITSSAHLGPSTRNAAYAAGAWEYCSQPVDVEQLLMKLRTFLRARQELKDARAQHCLDASTGLFTSHGLEQVTYQLRARAAREGQSLTCLTIAPARAGDDGAAGHALSEGDREFADVANICRLHSRKSDFIGRAASARVAILAPDTDALGARALVARLQHGLDEASRTGAMSGKYHLRAGYCSIADAAGAKLAPADLFGRAATALERLQATGSHEAVMGFEETVDA